MARPKFSVDKNLNKIFDEAEEHFKSRGITRQQIKDIYFNYFRYVARAIASRELPYIVLPKFGKLIPLTSKINYYIGYFRKKGDQEVADKYAESKKRLEQEKQKRRRK